MISGLLKLILLVILIVAAGVYFLGWDTDRLRGGPRTDDAVDASGAAAREAGATAREKTAQAADATMRAIEDGRLTTKIKAKMALDDSVKALNLDVDTSGSVVTVSGEVRSEAERQRALALARETEGVKQVLDKIRIR